jgi:heptosyltransferase III
MQLAATFGDGNLLEGDHALPRTGIFQILVCRTSHSLGNTLFITPLMQEIQEQWPGAEVDLVTRFGGAKQIFGSYRNLRRIFHLPKQTFHHPVEAIKALYQMRATHYDLAIDTDLRSRTGRLLLILSRARYKVGFSGRGKLTHEVALDGAPKHAGHFPVFLLRKALGLKTGNCPLLSTQLTQGEMQQGWESLDRVRGPLPKNKLGVVGVFANATGPKKMSQEWWREFMSEIEPHLASYCIIEIIPAFGRSMLGSRYPAYFSSNIRNLSQFLSGLTMLISLDCGIMHLARASGTAVGAVFTTTDVDQWGPYGPGAFFVKGDREHPAEAARQLMNEFR